MNVINLDVVVAIADSLDFDSPAGRRLPAWMQRGAMQRRYVQGQEREDTRHHVDPSEPG